MWVWARPQSRHGPHNSAYTVYFALASFNKVECVGWLNSWSPENVVLASEGQAGGSTGFTHTHTDKKKKKQDKSYSTAAIKRSKNDSGRMLLQSRQQK